MSADPVPDAVDVVAEAIWKVDAGDFAWADLEDDGRDHFRRMARAAIVAMVTARKTSRWAPARAWA
jgi:hypothetical protein